MAQSTPIIAGTKAELGIRSGLWYRQLQRFSDELAAHQGTLNTIEHVEGRYQSGQLQGSCLDPDYEAAS